MSLRAWWQKFKADNIIADDDPTEPILQYVIRTEAGIYFAGWPGHGEPLLTSRIQQAEYMPSRWHAIHIMQQIDAARPDKEHRFPTCALWTVLPVARPKSWPAAQ